MRLLAKTICILVFYKIALFPLKYIINIHIFER